MLDLLEAIEAAAQDAPASPRLVRAGLITAELVERQPAAGGGAAIVGPLRFDEAVVAEDGVWPLDVGEGVADALNRVYRANYAAWCARLDASRAKERAAAPRLRRPAPATHTPCPALWAGR